MVICWQKPKLKQHQDPPHWVILQPRKFTSSVSLQRYNDCIIYNSLRCQKDTVIYFADTSY